MSISCPNKRLKVWKDLVQNVGENKAYVLWAEYDGNVPDNYYKKLPENLVKTGLKAVDILQSDKAKQVFDKGQKNKWSLDKILTELQVPKEQKQLILDLGITDREQIALELASKYSFAVEINTAKSKEDFSDSDTQEIVFTTQSGIRYYGDYQENYFSKNKETISKEEFVTALNNNRSINNSSYYSNLTVPGGTNYTENEIATPAITPSIKGHAQFATDNGIGWFRSDEKTKENTSELMFQEDLSGEMSGFEQEYSRGGTPTKTRRILEVQSDLFQKGRGKDVLAKREYSNISINDVIIEHKNENYTLLPQGYFENKDNDKLVISSKINEDNKDDYQLIRNKENNNLIVDDDLYSKLQKLYDNTELGKFNKEQENKKDNQFLQLLNKDNNWVTFFVKSIIQDSAKKEYEKVLFPTGNTASKIEGHTTLEEFKKQKEDRIKMLERQVSEMEENALDPAFLDELAFRNADIENGPSNVNIDEEINRNNEEINQLKQELERVETEGFGALKPIYNFYENTVTNILKKQGYNPTLITDEYDNTWNEITLDNQRDESIIFMKKDLSEFESEENESIFSESILENRAEIKQKGNEIVSKLFPSSNTTYTLIGVINKLEKLFKNNNDDFIADVLNKLTKLKSSHNLIIKIVDKSRFKPGTVMQYNSDTKEIEINLEVLEGYSDSTIISSILHELTHHITVDLLSKPYDKLTLSEKDLVDTIKKFYNKYKSKNHNLNKNANFKYGFTTIEEFVAEFYGNPDFRNYTKSLSDNWFNDFIKSLTDAFRRLINVAKNTEFDNLMNKIFNYVENSEFENNPEFNLYVKKDIFAKQIKDAETYELETIDKKVDHLINKAKSKIAELINRTKKSNKEKSAEFLEEFRKLEKEIETISAVNKWKAITSYMLSFKRAIDRLQKGLDSKFQIGNTTYNGVEYTKIKNLDVYKSKDGQYIIPEDVIDKIDKEWLKSKDIIVDSQLYNNIENQAISELSNKDYLELANNYEDYLASYDLLEDIKKLINDTTKDSTLSREDKLEIRVLKDKINEISKPHDDLIAKIKKLKKESAIKLFSDTSVNKKIINKWKNKLSLQYDKLKNPKESKLEWIGNQMATTYSEEIKKDLEEAAKSIIENPYMDITSFAKTWVDLLNINSPLISMMANIVGKMRDSILKEITTINFKIDKVFQEYSNFNNSLSMSKKNGNLVELNESEDTYYLKGKYSIKFKENYNKMLNSLLEKNKDIENYDYKKDEEYKKWIKENTIKDELGQTIPHSKYLNKPLNPAEEKVLDFFRTRTKSNHELNYKGKGGLYSTFFGAEYYKLPSKTKSNRERTLEGDIKGQVKDAWTDLKETKVDDINYGQAFDSRGEELKRVQINYRGKIESKNQSLDLFTVYRAEETNAISFKHRSANESKLKLFLDIAKDKQYKKKSLFDGKWAKNIFSKQDVQGQTFSGEFSNEAQKIKGILETALYDVTSYNEEKILGSLDANKITTRVNSAASFIGMTLNIGSGFVNFLNGQTMMTMLRIGGKYINEANLIKAEANYTTSLPKILADISNPVKKSFHNQMLNMFDIIGGMNINKQDFLNNSTVKEMMSLHNTNFVNESIEHGLNAILTEAILRSIPVMNKQHKYIDKEGNVVSKEKAASIFDMLYLDENGILKTKDYFTYSEYNLVDNYHTSGKQSINYLLKKKVEDLYGVYDNNMKAEISKKWYGKLVLMFKSFFLSQAIYRYKGIGTANKSKDELDDEDLTFNNAEQEFTEGIYTTVIRTFWPLLRHLNLQMTRENFKTLSDYEKANLKQAFFEVSLTAIILPLLGAIMAANAGDDDDELYFLLFAFRRLESELSQFRNIAELNRMISNPIAANRFLQNGFTVINDIITPINFTPKENESYFDWLSENSKGENIMINHAFKLAPGKTLFMNTYKQRYSLMDR